MYQVPQLGVGPEIEWSKVYGGSKDDYFTSLQQTQDGGYIVAGFTDSRDWDILYNNGKRDWWILKLDGGGHIEWSKTYGGRGPDFGFFIQQAKDEGYVVAAVENSLDGDLQGVKAPGDYWIFKLDPFGNVVWSKTYGSKGADIPYSISITKDGGYVVGISDNKGRDVPTNHGHFDYWILKLKPFR